MRLLYDIGVHLYHGAVRLAAWRSPKARAWIAGRIDLEARLGKKAVALEGCIWMHCASVGEFEQGRPVLEALRTAHPGTPVLLTFFSPSGFEAYKDSDLAEHVEYLPADTPANATRFLDLVRPSKAIFVKYEFWYHHLAALKHRKVPTFLIAALFRSDQPFFRWYGGAWRRMLDAFTAIGTQDEASAALLRGLGYDHVSVCGDPRFDRVLAIRASASLAIAEAFRHGHTTLVLGSTWPADEAALLPLLQQQPAVRTMIAPHELTATHLADIENSFPKPLMRWTELESNEPKRGENAIGHGSGGTLLVDRMGLLSRLYAHGDIAYVGGGFGDGIHNLLEAAVWGIPVVFGPKHRKFPEAIGLVRAGGGFAASSADELRQHVSKLLSDNIFRQEAGRNAQAYVTNHAGATERSVEMISTGMNGH